MARTSQPIKAPPDHKKLVRVILAAFGVVIAYWNTLGLPAQHPYRQALHMVDSYLRKNYL